MNFFLNLEEFKNAEEMQRRCISSEGAEEILCWRKAALLEREQAHRLTET